MPAPRLLDKKLVNTEVAQQKKQQIDQGIAIAKKVDAVRTTLQEEEMNLEMFRQESIARVKREIDAKIAERDELEQDIAKRREERIRLEAPIDLKEAWDEVKVDKRNISEWQERLTSQSVEYVAKEGTLKDLSDRIHEQNAQSLKNKETVSQMRKEAEGMFEKATTHLAVTQDEAATILSASRIREQEVTSREAEVNERDASITKRELINGEHEEDLSAREESLKSNQKTQSAKLLTREQNLLVAQQSLDSQSKDIERKNELADARVQEANGKLKEATAMLTNAQADYRKTLKSATDKEQKVIERENRIVGLEMAVREREQVTAALERDLVTREKAVEEKKDNLDLLKGHHVLRKKELEELEQKLERQSKEIVRKDELAEELLQDSEKKHREAIKVLEKAQKDSTKLMESAKKKEMEVMKHELETEERDNLIIDREREVNEHEIDLSNREKALKVRYETFLKAQNYLKAKQK